MKSRIFHPGPYFFLCALLLTISSVAQTPYFYNLKDVYEFNVSGVYEVHQSKDQHLWFGTDQGLYEFDGEQFLLYKLQGYQQEFTTIQEDPSGRIWVHNFSGQLFYAENGQLKLAKDFAANSSEGIISYDISDFPSLLVATDLGITKYTITEQADTISEMGREGYLIRNFRKENKIYSVLKQVDDLYYCNGANMYKLKDGKEKWLYKFSSIKERVVLYRGATNPVAVIKKLDGFLEIVHFKENELQTVQYKPEYEIIPQSLFWDEAMQRYWLGTYSGVIFFDKDFNPINNLQSTLKDYAVTHIIKDREGNYVVSTLYNGVLVIPDMNVQKLELLKENGTLAQGIRDIEKNNEILYTLDDSNTLYSYNTQTSESKLCYSHPLRASRIYNLPGVGDGAVSLFPSSIYYDDATDTPKESALRNIKHLSPGPDSTVLISQSSRAILGNLHNIIAKDLALNHLAENKKKDKQPALFDFDARNEIKVLREKRSIYNAWLDAESFYVSYSDGLYYYHKTEGVQELYHQNKPLIIVAMINKDGAVYAVGAEGGVYKLNHTDVELLYKMPFTLYDIRAYQHYLLLLSSDGLVRFDLRNKKYVLINKFDGLEQDNLHALEVVGEYIYMASESGLVRLPVKGNYFNEKPPIVKVNSLLVNAVERDLGEDLRLKPEESNLTFTLSSYAMRAQGTQEYAYKMHDQDTSWQYSSNNRIQLSGLSPGSYHFQFRALNEDGVSSEVVSLGTITIMKPIYQRWWFYASTSFLLVLIVLLIFNRRYQQQKAKNELQKRLAESTLVSLRSQMNPHFLFNAINGVQSFILEGKQDQSYTYLNRLASVVRLSLTNSEENFVSGSAELDLLKSYLELEKLRFDEPLNYELIEAERLEGIKIPSMIIQPFLENAIRHGLFHKKGAKNVSMKFDRSEHLTCVITDNGIGREASERINRRRVVSHFSTKTIEKRFTILRDYYKLDLGFEYIDLFEEDGTPKGTQVIIRIPFVKDRA
jgi:ligand-binding sensor domain-containing protein